MFLVTNDLTAADLVHAYFCQTYKNAQARSILGRESAIQKAKTIRLFSVKIAIVNCQRSAQPPSANAVYLVYRGAIMQKR